MYEDVVTQEEFEAIQKEKLGKGLTTVNAPKGEPVYIQFKMGGAVVIEDASSKNWHISSNDASWRFSSNSGTTSTAANSGGNGGVKVFKGVRFNDIKNINHTVGLVNSIWEIDKLWNYNSSVSGGNINDLSLNYYLTKNLNKKDYTQLSETYLFDFNGKNMESGNAYVAGTDYIYLIKDGNGNNYVKVQAIEIRTDGSGMSYDNRVYVFNYQLADGDGNFTAGGS